MGKHINKATKKVTGNSDITKESGRINLTARADTVRAKLAVMGLSETDISGAAD